MEQKKLLMNLVSKYNYPHSEWMQDWPYEVADYTKIEDYFNHYDEQTNDDKKFSLMEMLIQALTDIEN